jgi:hypothetical protein
MKQLYRHVVFAVEDERRFEGFMPQDLRNEPFGGYWNGWLCPYVNEETHKEILQYMKESVVGIDESWCEGFLEDLQYYEESKPNADGLYYWGGCYIWSEVDALTYLQPNTKEANS